MSSSSQGLATPNEIRAAVHRALRGGQFFVSSGALRIEHVEREPVAWEVYRGHLLDPAHTRQSAEFETWNVYPGEESTAGAAVISILWQPDVNRMHVVRRILSHAFEAYEESPGVILSRPTQKWLAELVGTIDLNDVDTGQLPKALANYLLLAVIGTSRLPITSLESPLPAFSLGQLGYIANLSEHSEPWSNPVDFLRSASHAGLSFLEQAKAIETALRAADDDHLADMSEVVRNWSASARGEPDWLEQAFRTVFNTSALSPYTEFTNRMIAVLLLLGEGQPPGPATIVDIVSYMLRHLCRHLTAFDLTLFHNLGANYPDALFMDALLRAYLRLIERRVSLYLDEDGDDAPLARRKRIRRRALREACLLRKHYEGHRVPDVPTSLGENARVLPAPHAGVPEEQILQAARRRRSLFDNAPTDGLLGPAGRRVFDQSLVDLEQPGELAELGSAHFLDRPLGVFKAGGEVDRTPLLSYEAFSQTIAKRRLGQLKAWSWISAERQEHLVGALNGLPLGGLPTAEVAAVERPGVATLADVHKVAADFRLLRTTRSSLDDLLGHYDWLPPAAAATPLAQWLSSDRNVLLVPHLPPEAPLARATLRAYDRFCELRLELEFDVAAREAPRYRERAGVELVEQLRPRGMEPPTELRLRGLQSTSPKNSHQLWNLPMLMRAIVVGILLIHASASCIAAPKNVVLVVADDLGTMLGCYGNPVIKSPHLDALAADGTLFTNAFCTTASCSPSRSVILSGMYNHANGQYGLQHAAHHFTTLDKVRSLSARLHDANYRTARIGKFHVAPDDVYPFDEVVEGNPRNGVQMAERCRRTIESQDSRPFFLYFCVTDPHRDGQFGPAPYRPNLFGNEQKHPGVDEVCYDPKDVVVPPYLPDTPTCRAELAEYYQSASRVDQGVGRLIKILKDAGHWDDTLFVFLSDNGPPFPAAKTTVYEPGLRLPCLVRNPYLSARGVRSRAVVTWVDIAPTVLEFAGAASSGPDLHGRSFLKILDQENPSGWDEGYASHTFHEVTMYYPMRVVRKGNYKLIWNIAHPLPFPFASDLYRSATWQEALQKPPDALYGRRTIAAYVHRPAFELYDLENDPDEIRNLADDTAHAHVLADLKTKLKEFQKRTNDPWILKWDYE